MRGNFGLRAILLIITGITILWANQNQFVLSTDKARYLPGDVVTLTITKESQGTTAKLAIYQLEENIFSKELSLNHSGVTQLRWKTPEIDFQGYLVDVVFENGSRHSIAVDVSSDWAKFIRYGFLSKFPEMTASEMDAVLYRLNRFHINGLQFYDYHYMHQQPVKLEQGKPAEKWPDIAGRLNYSKTIQYYIHKSRQYNMKSMAYNLIYGTWGRGFDLGVDKQWMLYNDKKLTDPKKLDFPDSWQDDIYYMDPGNEEWQNYLIENTKPVLEIMEFDGWHIDQIGDIRPAYNNEQVNVKLDSAFTPFLQHIKADLEAPLVMNAVNQYGQKNIANSDVVEFLYTEVWDPHVTFQDLVNVIRKNDEFSNHQLSTVLAAYMNYEKSDEKGVFNTPGILLADAVIFASGAVHLELGEHMLVHEYFPNDNRKMSAELTNNLVRYYDFMTAYQSLLRDSRETDFLESINSETHLLSREPEQGKIWISQRETDDYQLVHLINFTSMKTMQWRDPQGTCPEPELLENIELDIHQDIGDVYIMTPDTEDLRPQKIRSNNAKVVVPSLKYWTTIIIKRNS